MTSEQLLGTWDIVMEHSAMAEPVRARQVYTPVLEGAFLRLEWTYEHPDFPDATAFLTDTVMHYFDVRGVVRVFDVSWEDGGFTMVHPDPEFAQRFTTTFEGPDLMTTIGEASEDNGVTWQYDFTTTARRVLPAEQLLTR